MKTGGPLFDSQDVVCKDIPKSCCEAQPLIDFHDKDDEHISPE